MTFWMKSETVCKNMNSNITLLILAAVFFFAAIISFLTFQW